MAALEESARVSRRDKTSLSGRLRRYTYGVFKHRAIAGLRPLWHFPVASCKLQVMDTVANCYAASLDRLGGATLKKGTTTVIPHHVRSVAELDKWLASLDRWAAAKVLRQMDHRPPRFLYKYLASTSMGLRSLIVDSQLWLSSHEDFNDPFEMAAKVALEGSPKQIMDRLRQIAKTNGINGKARETTALQMYAAYRNAPSTFQDSYGSRTAQQGVFCFTAAGPRNLLMWSHYGEQHKGACLQFHASRAPSMHARALRVEYSNDYLSINWAGPEKERAEQLARAIFRKSQAWSYEKEYRLCFGERARSLEPIRAAGLTGIVLGAAASKGFKQHVDQLCKERALRGHPAVNVFQARRAGDAYRLIVDKLPRYR